MCIGKVLLGEPQLLLLLNLQALDYPTKQSWLFISKT